MAEPGKETVPPPEAQTMDRPSSLTAVEPVEGIATPPPPPPPGSRPAAPAVASGLETTDDEPVQPPHTAEEAGGEPPAPTEADEVAASPPPPSQEMAPAVEAEKPMPVPAAPPLQQPPPQQQKEGEGGGGGAAEEEASSVRQEEKGAAPEEKLAAAPMAQGGRRRWRQLQAAVRLIFLPCKRAARGGDQSTPQPPLPEQHKGGESETTPPASGEEEKNKPTPPDEGESKQPAASGKEQVVPPPSPEETSPQETAAAEDAKPLAAPPPQKQEEGGAPEQASSVQEEEKGAASPATARRRWRLLWSASNLLFLRPKSKNKENEAETKPASGKKEKKPADVPDKDESEGGKDDGRHDETEASAAVADEGTAAAPPAGSMAKKRFRKAGKRVMRIMSWYKRHRSSSSRVGGEPGAAAADKGDGITPATAQDGDKSAAAAAGIKPAPASGTEVEEEGKPKLPPHPKWAREEARLERILEDSFTRLLAAEFHRLRPVRKRCLLTFSVFDLAAEVKKQAMLYWWVSEFNLRHRTDQSPDNSDDAAAAETTATRRGRRRGSCLQQPRKSKAAAPAAGAAGNHQSPVPPPPQGNNKAADGGGGDNTGAEAAEGVFSDLSSHGFLEPMKNWCTRAIHGCKVNPLVHWMVKRRARDDRFADLDGNGNPAILQTNSGILCLTAGNRPLLQQMRMEDESQQAGNKPKTVRRTTSSVESAAKDKEQAQDQKNIPTILDHDEIARLFKGKRVILNVNAHVYPMSKSTFLHLADCLVVLQLGRWCNHDDDTYMEVDGLESLSTIGSLKNLRYLSLRGLSRLTELPIGIRLLKKLAILDMRGCQNLVNVASKITMPLRQLTHLDLTECYMLEHIGRGIIFLSELQVFKGFVFATGTQGNKSCRLQDLKRLKKLQKLTISITTDANVGKGEMAELKYLASLRKLTITWSEIPSILDGDSEMVKKRRVDLIEKWTSFELPTELLKLDLRCYPKNELKLKVHKSLKKLYLRGGDLEKFSIYESNLTNSSEKSNSIKILRVRYLKNFSMEWEEIRSSLKDIEYVEIVSKDEKINNDMDKDQKGKNMDIKDQKDNNMDMKDQKNIDTEDLKDTKKEGKLVKNIEMKDMEKESKLVKHKKILYSTLDENGIWVKDNKEEEYLRCIE
ncbi:unnamed protein product [Urochloa humidicola]